MSGYVDIHAHVLPGIDDGPDDEAGALEMARSAVGAGTRILAATPHLRGDFPRVHVHEIAERCARLSEALAEANISLEIVPAGEVSLVWALEADEEAFRAATFAQRGTDMLIETPEDVTMLDQLVSRIQARDVRVVLAHPERSPGFQRRPEVVRRLADQEILLQVNADALLANARSPRRRLAEHLCTEGLAHVIASDAHRGHEWRPVTVLPEGVAALSTLVGPDRAQWMAEAAPAAVVTGTALARAPEVQRGRRGLLGRLRG